MTVTGAISGLCSVSGEYNYGTGMFRLLYKYIPMYIYIPGTLKRDGG